MSGDVELVLEGHKDNVRRTFVFVCVFVRFMPLRFICPPLRLQLDARHLSACASQLGMGRICCLPALTAAACLLFCRHFLSLPVPLSPARPALPTAFTAAGHTSPQPAFATSIHPVLRR